ncbi:quinone-dependent dihydroorotate dehydrogenase [Pseudanabaena sp. PCC 6802]|uniref:quinone-dependent dihydroorotate dehydrogenase n=1 Tax=Pseudanabaena sp. PCC 6802 TaxID=118173 RepID=UPI000346AA66|nr:quinone-dependent dihydroorotate dehydrogenase [Pseudanabaena sp. PCC 6802]
MLDRFYQYSLRNLLFALDPEIAHKGAIAFCQALSNSPSLRSPIAKLCSYQHDYLRQTLWGIEFANPVGLAAGFDKDAIAPNAWACLGFGFAEMGSITYHAQTGNPQPRLFRLSGDRAVLNRMGFNNRGAIATAAYLRDRLAKHKLDVPLGINLGKSKITPLEEAGNDYLESFKLLKDCGDYFVVNVSSPNTPGLRDLQAVGQLQGILSILQVENNSAKPLLVKIAPDLADDDIRQIVSLCLLHRVAGIIATNTSIARNNLSTQILSATGKPVAEEAGGISGQPLKARSTEVIRLIYQATSGNLPIIGVGGIFTAADAWEKIVAGASLVQIYTGWIYQGPLVVRQILEGLVLKMREAGFSRISQAIGSANDLTVI